MPKADVSTVKDLNILNALRYGDEIDILIARADVPEDVFYQDLERSNRIAKAKSMHRERHDLEL